MVIILLNGEDERIVTVLTARMVSVQETAQESPLPPQRSDSSYIPNTTASRSDRSDRTSGTAGSPSEWRADPEERHHPHRSEITRLIKHHTPVLSERTHRHIWRILERML